MSDLYREIIIDRYKNPLYRGSVEPHDYSFEDDNPLCGDHVRIEIRVGENGHVQEARFTGQGCAISQASADLMLEELQGRSLEELKEYSKEDLLDLLGIELGPVRLKCALLPLKVMKAAIYGLGEAPDDLGD